MTVLLKNRLDDILFTPPSPGTVLSLPGLPQSGGRIHDRSPYGNHGAITGATWRRLPSGLWVLSFDGSDDFVSIGDIANLASFTVKFWLKMADTTTAEPFFKSGTLTFDIDGGTAIYVILTGTGGGYIGRSGAWTAETTKYHHFVWTWDGGATSASCIFYVDGVRTDTANYQAGIFTALVDNANALRLGSVTGLIAGEMGLLLYQTSVWTIWDVQKSFNQEKALFEAW